MLSYTCTRVMHIYIYMYYVIHKTDAFVSGYIGTYLDARDRNPITPAVRKVSINFDILFCDAIVESSSFTVIFCRTNRRYSVSEYHNIVYPFIPPRRPRVMTCLCQAPSSL